MMTKNLITSKDPKGLHAVSLFEAAYNKICLTDEQAQMLNEKGGELKDGVQKLIRELITPNQYASEVVSSSYTYPKEYKGPKPIAEQVKIISEIFGLDSAQALEFIKTLPKELPEGAEGWFAVPKVSVIAKKFFPAITNPTKQYCEAVNMVLEKIAKSRDFYNYRKGEIMPTKLRQHSRTISFLEQLETQQKGDILIVAVQHGMRHRGKSVRRARETFISNEFGLTSFMLGCMALVHPERYMLNAELDTDCAGDEFSPGGDGVFSGAPLFDFGGGLRFAARGVSGPRGRYGSASAFIPR